MKVLLTGASGFIGKRMVLKLLENKNITLRIGVRSLLTEFPKNITIKKIKTIDRFTDWKMLLNGADLVLHLAARVHITNTKRHHSLKEFRKVNVEGTLNLAKQSAIAGVRRFVFLSSIKVNGSSTLSNQTFSADDPPNPTDPYAISKFEAEKGLRKIEVQTGMEVVIVRSPLVYGPGVKANFAAMVKLVGMGIPLPLGAINNSRSMVALDNLIDLLVTVMSHPAAAGETFLVSDGEDISTSKIIQLTAKAMNKKILLFPVPIIILRLAGILFNKSDEVNRLSESLQIDINKTRFLLGWTPRLTLVQGLKRTVEGIK